METVNAVRELVEGQVESARIDIEKSRRYVLRNEKGTITLNPNLTLTLIRRHVLSLEEGPYRAECVEDISAMQKEELQRAREVMALVTYEQIRSKRVSPNSTTTPPPSNGAPPPSSPAAGVGVQEVPRTPEVRAVPTGPQGTQPVRLLWAGQEFLTRVELSVMQEAMRRAVSQSRLEECHLPRWLLRTTAQRYAKKKRRESLRGEVDSLAASSGALTARSSTLSTPRGDSYNSGDGGGLQTHPVDLDRLDNNNASIDRTASGLASVEPMPTLASKSRSRSRSKSGSKSPGGMLKLPCSPGKTPRSSPGSRGSTYRSHGSSPGGPDNPDETARSQIESIRRSIETRRRKIALLEPQYDRESDDVVSLDLRDKEVQALAAEEIELEMLESHLMLLEKRQVQMARTIFDTLSFVDDDYYGLKLPLLLECYGTQSDLCPEEMKTEFRSLPRSIRDVDFVKVMQRCKRAYSSAAVDGVHERLKSGIEGAFKGLAGLSDADIKEMMETLFETYLEEQLAIEERRKTIAYLDRKIGGGGMTTDAVDTRMNAVRQLAAREGSMERITSQLALLEEIFGSIDHDARPRTRPLSRH